ncbi:MAG: NADH-quinone oxidoreductase subunit A [Bacteroidia bacterium]
MANILLYFILGTICISAVIVLSYFLAPHKPNPEKLTTYECGEDAVGNTKVQFNMRFYVIGLIFLLFDVEILFLFPWSTVFADEQLLKNIPNWGIFTFIEMSLFVLILLAGLVYVWAKGDLEWAKPQPIAPQKINPVPDALYEKVNERYG